MTRLSLCALLLLCPAVASAWPGVVLSVHDGDTVTIAPAGDAGCPMRIRLYGIDAPELEQDGGIASRDHLHGLLPQGAAVEVIPKGEDRYGRTVALIARDGHVVNSGMVADGQAWVFTKYCRDAMCKRWHEAQKDAARRKTGIWKARRPVAPWKWRHQKTG